MLLLLQTIQTLLSDQDYVGNQFVLKHEKYVWCNGRGSVRLLDDATSPLLPRIRRVNAAVRRGSRRVSGHNECRWLSPILNTINCCLSLVLHTAATIFYSTILARQSACLLLQQTILDNCNQQFTCFTFNSMSCKMGTCFQVSHTVPPHLSYFLGMEDETSVFSEKMQ